jgi:hypothetical protein
MAENLIDYYDLAEQIVRAQLQRDALDEQITSLKSHFRDAKTAEISRDGRPSIIVKVTPNKRIDDKLAREHLDDVTYNTISKQTIDTAKARAFLSDEQIAKIEKVYDNKVEVKLA